MTDGRSDGARVVASTYAGCVSTLLGHPLDCVKVRMQTVQQNANSRVTVSTMGVMRDMIRTEGLPAFGRGIMPPLLSAVALNTLSTYFPASLLRDTASTPPIPCPCTRPFQHIVSNPTLSPHRYM